jgi:SdrD B-like domain
MKNRKSLRRGFCAPLEQLESRTLLTATTFTLNPTLSTLTNSGSALGYSLTAQAAGSLTTSFSGTIGANVSTGSIQFTGNSTITAALNADKTLLPGSSPADFGGAASTPFGTADVAIRNAVANLTSAAITVAANGSFPSTGETIAMSKGEVDYLAPFVGTGSKTLVGLSSKNTGAASTLITSAGVETLTIPVKIVLTYTLLSTNDSTLTLSGKLVATAKVAPPPPPTTITGNVFKDVNGDGKKETGDANFAGVTVTCILLVNGKVSTTKFTTKTNSAGNYTFTKLKAGTYQVSESVAGYRVTTPVGGFSDVKPGAVVNFGDSQTVKISGSVFNDANDDKKLDNGETTIAGFTVWVDVNHDGVFDAGDLSSTTATFSFILKAGTYVVHIKPRTGYTLTTPTTAIFTEKLAAGATVTGLLFGEHKV